LLELGFRHLLAHGSDLRRRLGKSIFALFILGDVEKKTRFLEVCAMFRPSVNDGFQRGLLLENCLSFLRVVPEIGFRGDLG
jgi:hypothetical protein